MFILSGLEIKILKPLAISVEFKITRPNEVTEVKKSGLRTTLRRGGRSRDRPEAGAAGATGTLGVRRWGCGGRGPPGGASVQWVVGSARRVAWSPRAASSHQRVRASVNTAWSSGVASPGCAVWVGGSPLLSSAAAVGRALRCLSGPA